MAARRSRAKSMRSLRWLTKNQRIKSARTNNSATSNQMKTLIRQLSSNAV